MREREEEVGHEKLRDFDLRIPSIKGLGTGCNFQLENLILPRNFFDLIKNLDPKIDLSKVFGWKMERDCCRFSLPLGQIEFRGNLLSQIVFGGLGSRSRLFLDEDLVYKFEDVGNIRTAIVLAKITCEYLNLLTRDRGRGGQYAYVGYSEKEYLSQNLTVPKDLAEQAKKENGENFQRMFGLEAANIAGRFGVTTRTLQFEGQLLRWFDIKEGNACGYGILESSIVSNSYSAHNVDTPQQALALHGIGAAYINRLLDMRH